MTNSNALRNALKHPLVIVALILFAAIIGEAFRSAQERPLQETTHELLELVNKSAKDRATEGFDANWQELGRCLDSQADLCSCGFDARAVIRSGNNLRENFGMSSEQLTEMVGLARNVASPC